MHKQSTTELKYKGSYCDDRILAWGFTDCSYVNDITGSVHKKIGDKEVEIYCPNSIADEGDGHNGFTHYTISVDQQWAQPDKQYTVDEVIAFIRSMREVESNTKIANESLEFMEYISESTDYVKTMRRHIEFCEQCIKTCLTVHLNGIDEKEIK